MTLKSRNTKQHADCITHLSRMRGIGIRVGYARVSTSSQKLDLQYRALEQAGCDIVFTDRATGRHRDRAGLNQALRACRPGDELVVWKIDRLGRRLADLIHIVETLDAHGVGLHILAGAGATIDISRPEGRMVFGICAIIAEFEHALIRERTCAGKGVVRQCRTEIGRPPRLKRARFIGNPRHVHDAGNNAMSMGSLSGIFHGAGLRYAVHTTPLSSRFNGHTTSNRSS